VVLSTGAYKAQLSQSSLSAMPAESGFGPWLENMGISIDQMLVMDPQNSSFPVPVSRNVGGFTFQDLVMLDYPYFVDVRGDGLSDDLPITSGIPQVTLSWASPIGLSVDENIDVFTLLESSSGSWLSDDTNVMPRLSETGEPAFETTGELSTHKLGVLLTGVFGSYFSGQDSPLLEEPVTDDPESQDSDQAESKDSVVISSVIEKSSESARLLVISSNDFLSDQSLQMVGSSDGTLYMNSPQMIVNFVDWALEDESLTSIRARGNFNRTLLMSNETSQRIFEYVNYILAILSVLAVAWFYRIRSGRERAIQESWLAGEGETS
jgi:ABC-2 type transport system permease protein